MFVRSIRGTEMAMLSQSVQGWYKHYKAVPDEWGCELLCSAAIDLFNEGHETQEELTSLLIARYPGPAAMIIHARSSSAHH